MYVKDFFCRILKRVGPVFSTNKTDRHNITKILLKLALNTIKRNTKMREECDNKGSNF
jgi:hypothetical protein